MPTELRSADAYSSSEVAARVRDVGVAKVRRDRFAVFMLAVLAGAFIALAQEQLLDDEELERVRKAIEPPGQARADWRVLCDLMAATGAPQPFQHPSEIMDEIAKVAPSFAGVSYARLEPHGLQWPVPNAEHPGTSILHTESFPVGRATFARVAYAPSPVLAHDDGFPLRLTTGRVLEHYNCGTMTRRSDNLVLRPADELELHADDARAAEQIAANTL